MRRRKSWLGPQFLTLYGWRLAWILLQRMRRSQRQWHEELDRITTSLTLIALDADAGVFDRVKRPTDIYLKKRRWFFSSATQEDQLNALIRCHSDKLVALLSCAHALSRPTIRSLLATPIELSVDLSQDSSTSNYLGLIASIHCVNNNAVSEAEAKRARALILMLEKKPGTFLRNLGHFFQVQNPVALYDIFPPGTLNALLKRLCLSFDKKLKRLRYQCKWDAAFEAIKELPELLRISPDLDALLRHSIRDIEAWVHWKPPEHRIKRRDEIEDNHRNELISVLKLDGPDFEQKTHGTLLEALLYHAGSQRMNHISHGHFYVWFDNHIGADSRRFMQGILDFPAGPRLSHPGIVDVFVFLCLRNPVDTNTLRVFEKAVGLGTPNVYQWLSHIFFSPQSSVRINAVMSLLGAVISLLRNTPSRHEPNLVDCLSGYIREIVQVDFKNMQVALWNMMENEKHKNSQPLASQIQALGRQLKEFPSLRHNLDSRMQNVLDAWPSTLEVQALFQLRADIVRGRLDPDLERFVDQYCLGCLTGRGIDEDEPKRLMVALLWPWQQQPHVPRQTLALSIVLSPDLPRPLQTECLLGIRDMGDDQLKALNSILCSTSEMATVHLAKLICSPPFQRAHRQQNCWKDLLMWMMEQRTATLLEHTLNQMDAQTWFEWLSHLGKIFNVVPNHQQPLLQQQLHSWAQLLESKYLPVLSHMELQGYSVLLVRPSLKDWQHRASIMKVLDFWVAGREHEPQHPFGQALDLLNNESRVVDGQVWDTLATLTTAIT